MPVIPSPGQIWRDPRNPAREVEVTGVESLAVHVKNTKTGRKGTLDRFNFTNIAIQRNRWIFVADAPGEVGKLG